MPKHFLLSHVAILSLSASIMPTMSAIQVMGQLPDTGIPMHLLIESDTAKTLNLLPTKNTKKFKAGLLGDIVKSGKVTGIKFVTKPDLNQLLSVDFLGEIGGTENPDTAVYIGTMPALTGDDDIGDGEIIVVAVGPQAKNIIEAFGDLGDHSVIDENLMKTFFGGLVADQKTGVTQGSTAKKRMSAATAA